ncbi:GNAT family N-acetyltransferase [Lysinibacillus pakistanensis]|uniref:GNAT family N-acetyltransferase n=1 Tax=Lysinibacillus pakistanensis TaxID=759811 RepID=A0AAX3WWY4_9BACI|nr:GNAT family N-acetyltransferase [Lysinibacillus pakistanensis]MDM5231841.1 GNAT family N-acetyltransferase [Lysinibacillus pakistanensis]WHY47379.1 GNAT family N-acetyltransferase [Lysinibacillus pakistanensis]WHY52388.1 GNAT family N-acetyltransferase [Lysinibacillus pakistanensis]
MEIRLFKIDEIALLMESIHRIWAKNHILARDEQLVRFMFYDNPNRQLITDDNHLTFVGAWIDGEVVGLLGAMPFEFNDQGKKGLAITLANWIVDPNYRDSGAGLALLDFVQGLNPNIILAMGLSEEAAKLYRLMRWSLVEDIPRWIGLNNKELTIQAILNGNEQPIRYVNPLKGLNVNSNISCFEITSLQEEEWEQYNKGFFEKKSIGVKRDSKFLKWRYFNHPTFNYRKFVCKDSSGITGLLIVRIELIQNQFKIGRIVEFIAKNQDSAVKLANELVALDSEILFYDFYCYSSISSWGLEAIGFKRTFTSQEDLFMLPTRFQPIDYLNTKLMTAMYISDKQTYRLNHIADQLWYITKGDADQDRPN